MEKAFRDKHGYGINEYEQDPSKIIEVEQRRDKEYAEEQKIVSDLEGQAHRDL